MKLLRNSAKYSSPKLAVMIGERFVAEKKNSLKNQENIN
jgi:hypothetical protein